jgi:ubiquinol-cytochrome c reductase iron-sulfur subunit
MRRLVRWLGVAAIWWAARQDEDPDHEPRAPIVPPGSPSPRAEVVVAVLLLLAGACGAGFVAAYAIDGVGHRTQLLGLALGGGLGCVAAALIVAAHHLVVTEELESEYGEPHPDAAADVDRLVRESGSRLRRRRLLGGAALAAGGGLALAAVTPVASLGPVVDLAQWVRTPWRRGRLLVDESGQPIAAASIGTLEFTTAYPQGANPEQLGAPVVLVRLDPSALRLPASRRSWAPQGILAYSKICTHAGCAIALYRAPLFQPVEQPPGLVCPCHYSTFDPATGGTVVFGPAGRPLPQLPLTIDRRGHLRAGGNFSGPVGPSWWGVRDTRPTS